MNKVIISMYFNDVDLLNGVNQTKEWIDYRMEIFNKFTLQSLKKQTDQNFIALLRYKDETEPLIFDALQHYDPLPDNIKFVKRKEVNPIIKQELTKENYDYVFIVRLDSDDMYHKNYVEKLNQYQPKDGTHFLINQKGYIYDSINQRLGYWECQSPPFFVGVYTINDYKNKVRYKVERGHSGVIKHPHEILNENNFMVVVHKSNTMTNFTKRLTGLIEDEKEMNRILKEFM